MKGFIEVTNSSKELIGVNTINRIHKYIGEPYQCKIYTNSEVIICKESYDQIKELIKKATA